MMVMFLYPEVILKYKALSYPAIVEDQLGLIQEELRLGFWKPVLKRLDWRTRRSNKCAEIHGIQGKILLAECFQFLCIQAIYDGEVLFGTGLRFSNGRL